MTTYTIDLQDDNNQTLKTFKTDSLESAKSVATRLLLNAQRTQTCALTNTVTGRTMRYTMVGSNGRTVIPAQG